LEFIRKETEDAIDNSFEILRNRIDHFGVTQPNIQRLETAGRILVELPGVKEPERVRKLLQGTASLEFWETYENSEIYNYLFEVDKKLKDLKIAENTKNEAINDSISENMKDSVLTAKTEIVGEEKQDTSIESENDLLSKLKEDSTNADSTKKDLSLLEQLESDTTNADSSLSALSLSFVNFVAIKVEFTLKLCE
jgi:SecD/SecF fusion protein